jgi:hypothetical protein
VAAGWANGGYKKQFLEHAAAKGITFQVASKPEGQKGFAVLPRRWVAERLSAGLSCTDALSGTSRPSRNVPSR